MPTPVRGRHGPFPAARPAEMRLATWDKIDTVGRVWVSPATRAGEILEAARTLGTAFQRLQRLVSSTASLSNAVPTATGA